MKVLYLRAASGLDRAYPYFADAIDERYQVEIFDPDKSAAEQFEGVEVVIDPGGAVGTRALIDMSLAAGVKLWHVTTNGTDHIDVAYFLENGMALANSPGPLSAVPLAEHALTIILYFAKNLNVNRADSWERILCDEMEGQVLGLIGFGASARELARRAWPLGMRIMATDVVAFPQAELDEFHVEFLGTPDQMDRVVAEADYLSLHLHLNSETRHLIDRRVFGLMKNRRSWSTWRAASWSTRRRWSKHCSRGRSRGPASTPSPRSPCRPTTRSSSWTTSFSRPTPPATRPARRGAACRPRPPTSTASRRVSRRATWSPSWCDRSYRIHFWRGLGPIERHNVPIVR